MLYIPFFFFLGGGGLGFRGLELQSIKALRVLVVFDCYNR